MFMSLRRAERRGNRTLKEHLYSLRLPLRRLTDRNDKSPKKSDILSDIAFSEE